MFVRVVSLFERAIFLLPVRLRTYSNIVGNYGMAAEMDEKIPYIFLLYIDEFASSIQPERQTQLYPRLPYV